MSGEKRRPPTRDEKHATLCLLIKRGDVPIISREEAKAMTPREIIREFDRRIHWHHNIERAIGGTMHPTNLEPLPPDEHKQIPSTSRVAKAERITKEHEDFQRRILAKSGQADPVARPESKIRNAGFSGWRKFDGTPVRARQFKGVRND